MPKAVEPKAEPTLAKLPDTVSEVLSGELNEKEKKKLDELSDFNF